MSKRLSDRVQDRNCFTCYLGYKIERRGAQQLSGTLRHLSSRQRRAVQEVEKTEHVIRNEDNKRGQDITDLSKYFRSNDFRRIEHGVTLEEARREYFQGILGRSKLLTCGKSGCGLFPCNPIKSYHFMFRKVQPKCSVHHVDLSVNRSEEFSYNRNNVLNKSYSSLELCQHSKISSASPLPDIETYEEQMPPHSQTNLQTNNDNDTLTKKERFLKLAVYKKRLENERRIFIDRAANYGLKKTPWRKLLKPVKPSTDDSVIGKRRFLTF